ncbi:MAG: hypothetical protein GXO28_02770 [Methanopyri archaeon]|nr:hypothetical protein [Methanopyri archaeon]
MGVRATFGLALVVLTATLPVEATIPAQDDRLLEEWALSHVEVAAAGGMISFAAAYALASVAGIADALCGFHRPEGHRTTTSTGTVSVYERGAAVGLKVGTALSPVLPTTSASIGVISGYLMFSEAWRGTLGEWADVLAGLGIVDASLKGAVLLRSTDARWLISLAEGRWNPLNDPRMEGVGLAVAGLLFLLPAMTATAELALGPLVVTLVTALNVWYAVKALTSDDLTLVPLALLEPGLVALCIAYEPVRRW